LWIRRPDCADIANQGPEKGGFVTEPGPSADARHLLRACRHGALATLADDGAPLSTLVAIASDERGAPLLLLSDLARHTANLRRDGRASLLLDRSTGTVERLAAPRLSLVGCARCLPDGDEGWRRRYLARHPEAERLFALKDFHGWRLDPVLGHLVAGFGRIVTSPAEELLVPEALARGLAAVAQGAIDHMHEDHADAIDLLAGGPGARIAAIDADGLDLVGPAGPVRRDFARRLATAEDLRAAVVEVVRRHRKS